MTDEIEQDNSRRQTFWLLKRLTSYSLWSRKRDAWEAFVGAYEDAVRHWPANELQHVSVDLLPKAHDALKLYDDGLVNLRRGHRFVWRTGQSFDAAERATGTIQNNFYRHPEYWERGMQLQDYPERIDALMRLLLAASFHGDQSPFEIPADADYRGARWSSPCSLLNPSAYDYGFYSLPYPVFPRTLPELPAGTDTLVRTGDTVPADGIWEPVAVSRKRLFGVIPFGKRKYQGSGCLNYFVMGSSAPRIATYNETTKRVDHVSTLWRLIWADERYRDGIIGDESEYFLQPEPQGAVR